MPTKNPGTQEAHLDSTLSAQKAFKSQTPPRVKAADMGRKDRSSKDLVVKAGGGGGGGGGGATGGGGGSAMVQINYGQDGDFEMIKACSRTTEDANGNYVHESSFEKISYTNNGGKR
ncbi:hypothetical protein CGCF415_v000775 [Colletotrichum fructicola]|uniref:Uncharacterized protein n=1 Tax=Colletotrichum fructicola (strain Nara gc5) TaxID=1213859 RepID=A0A7J6JBG0_COLFN|nr:uncharacterized protein CGMCC3_g14378 [Colletotrichum fructicola]KAF4486486.1 hypothetical protein CGGC5_v005709 [Colletotrichum fructicola Nara gc5]KAE9569581.1 hypothetical protein CGMCC3_g14378 [Colletotrichum fructicola]KAF4424106.1 hypothetical protein CFRS1_v006914 [Colletotrichum fructicola]KAF4889801.1 hypothetical protein CGCFRS4_v009161 [Colletotrichum fructicola]KAF4916502.1 hypothetical protein CGCF415_v000775 [Colletotrichum fructicola]